MTNISAEMIYLDCFVEDQAHYLDINTENQEGRWLPYSTLLFTNNSEDTQYRIQISDTIVLFGKKPHDYIEINLNTLTASAEILLTGGMDDDDLSGGMNDDDLSGGMNDDALSGGMDRNYCIQIPAR